MGEIKSVKVDNWGVFFLQKLQNFFNKTDYCDLTLQFNNNSQLKVHRLVLSACTDYFNVLEQTCDVSDDTLIMPRELQADVVVPIVNFMYTGTLEFELSMYGRLLKTARDMNMTVLLKLLEAHKRTVETSRIPPHVRPTPRVLNSPKKVQSATPNIIRPGRQQMNERTYTSPSTSTANIIRRPSNTSGAFQYKSIQIKPISGGNTYYQKPLPEPAAIIAKYPHSKTQAKGPSRFECADETTLPPETFESSFDAISYESKPLITATQICKEECDMEDYDNLIPKHSSSANQNSPFEQLRRSYTNNSNKRPASSLSSVGSPPDKKPNIQDVKEYAEQQRVRKQIAAEYDDDNECDDVLDDEFHNDDDDEDYVPPMSFQRQTKSAPQNKSVVLKQESEKKSMFVVKDTDVANVDHAKIISEVLKKYPHLVKKNTNFKLRIVPKGGNNATSQKVLIKEEPKCDEPPKPQQVSIVKKSLIQKPIAPTAAPKQINTTTTPPTSSVHPPQPKRIDSKTMHALIALGAENTTGPWLCLGCGMGGRPISIPSYRGFRRHLVNTHKEKIDPRLCEMCGWRSTNARDLTHHMLVMHNVKSEKFAFPECEYCPEILLDNSALEQHIITAHPEIKKSESQQCIYCNKTFTDEDQLYIHMRSNHKIRAQEDGVLDVSDDDESFTETEFLLKEQKESQQLQKEICGNDKIKILSNITLPKKMSISGQTGEASSITTATSLEPSSEAEALNNVASGIAASLGIVDRGDEVEDAHILSTEFINAQMEAIHSEYGSNKKMPKFVAPDGSIMELTQAQREEIISQLEEQHEGDVVMVLNEESFEEAEVNTSDSRIVMTSAETEQSGTIIDQEFVSSDPNMFIVYSQATNDDTAKQIKTVATTTTTTTTTTAVESASAIAEKSLSESDSQMEWQDNAEENDNRETKKENKKIIKDNSASKEHTDEEDELDRLNTSNTHNISDANSENAAESGYPTMEEVIGDKCEFEVNIKETSAEKSDTTEKLKMLTGDWSDDEEDENMVSKGKIEKDEIQVAEKTEVLYETVTISAKKNGKVKQKSNGNSDEESEGGSIDGKEDKSTDKNDQVEVEVEPEENVEKSNLSEDKNKSSESIEEEKDEITSDHEIIVEQQKTDESEEIQEEDKNDDSLVTIEETDVSEKINIKQSTETTNKTNDTDDKSEKKSDIKTSSVLTTKSEIKSLISDWVDEDDDDGEEDEL